MTTLIAQYNSDGCVGRCDAKCYNATSGHCDCICGGANHGSGKQQAITNTQQMAEQWIDDWQKNHPKQKHTFAVCRGGKLIPHGQLSLLEGNP